MPLTVETVADRLMDEMAICREGTYPMLKILSSEHRRSCNVSRLVSRAGRIKRDAMKHPRNKEFASILRRVERSGRASMDFQNADYGAGNLSLIPMPLEMARPPQEAANTHQGIITLVFWLDRVHVERLSIRRNVRSASWRGSKRDF